MFLFIFFYKKKNICYDGHFKIFNFTWLALLKVSFCVPNFHLWDSVSRKNYYGNNINILLYIRSDIPEELHKRLQMSTLVTCFLFMYVISKKKKTQDTNILQKSKNLHTKNFRPLKIKTRVAYKDRFCKAKEILRFCIASTLILLFYFFYFFYFFNFHRHLSHKSSTSLP